MNYSFRKKNKIVKFIILHYTGMADLKSAYKKLSSLNSNVSCHYLISRNGIIYNLLCPKIKAWHAGLSEWKNLSNLNDYSLGIELENKGHEFGYNNFTNKQYSSLKKLLFFLCSNHFIKFEDIIYHSDISPNRKKDPGEKFFIEKAGIKKKKFDYSTKFSVRKLLSIYGFSKNQINLHKDDCIKSVKRSLNYKIINSNISDRFEKNFYNLLINKKDIKY